MGEGMAGEAVDMMVAVVDNSVRTMTTEVVTVAAEGGRDYDREKNRYCGRDHDCDRYRDNDRGGGRRDDRCDREDFSLNHKDTFHVNRSVVEKEC